MSSSTVAQIPDIVARIRSHFATHISKSHEWRTQQIRGLISFLNEKEDELVAAIKSDIGRERYETVVSEIALCTSELTEGIHQLKSWMAKHPVDTPLTLAPAKSYIHYEPYGVALIIAPFNYPIQLTILPLFSAFAAGNMCVVKPSEMTPATSALMIKYLPRYVDPQAIAVIDGAIPETTALLKEKWDYIFFTGSEMVGRIVMKAAAENLTPVTLELGGKSPVIIEADADIPLTARRLMWGKFMNAGQTCTAPDYVYVHESIKQKLLAECKVCLEKFYTANPEQSKDYGRIINERHALRLKAIIDSHKDNIVAGGDVNVEKRYIAPTLIDLPVEEAAVVMKEELFGPILPFITFTSLTSVIHLINRRPKPLALYAFSNSQAVCDRVLKETSSGAFVFNDCVIQSSVSGLPFGGVGTSGMGQYHGKHGFTTMSHSRGVIEKSLYMDAPQRYPPYTEANLKMIRFLMSITRLSQERLQGAFKFIVMPLVLAALGYLAMQRRARL